ncbi:MAG: hypothetical protein ACJA1C_000493 [Crocinitomicaceae bacterium]|jgi:hypothetical protein
MNDFLSSSKKQFEYYKELGEKTFAQIPEDKLFWKCNDSSNSISTIVKHMHGNMLSRWTDFLTTDGEKEWRKQDAEFDNDIKTKADLLLKWNDGWQCLFDAIDPLTESDLEKEIFIRNMGHSITEAVQRQLAHYAYHVGQVVFIGKMIADENWDSLSIAKGSSKEYNDEKFSKPKRKEHFTDDL